MSIYSLLNLVSYVIASLAAIVFVTKKLSIPLCKTVGVTFLCPNRAAQIDLGRALSFMLGDPARVLDTKGARRFLFQCDVGVGWEELRYAARGERELVALLQIVLPVWSLKTPRMLAEEWQQRLAACNIAASYDGRPDPKFRHGDSVLVVSPKFKAPSDGCFGVLIRRDPIRTWLRNPNFRLRRFPGWEAICSGK